MCTLKQEKADWDTAKRVLGDSGFMRSLLEFDKDHIPDSVMKKLRKYTDSPDFTPEAVAKQSKAAQSLCMWCRAMEVYDRIAKVPGMALVSPQNKQGKMIICCATRLPSLPNITPCCIGFSGACLTMRCILAC